MTKRRLLAASLVAIAFFATPAIAQKDGILKHPDPDRLAMDEVEDNLLLMVTDGNRRTTKQEWMKFMATEFDKLDRAKSAPSIQRRSRPPKNGR